MSHWFPAGMEVQENPAHPNHRNMFDPAVAAASEIRIAILCAQLLPNPVNPDPDNNLWELKPSIKHVTLADVLNQANYIEYDGAGYPGPSGGSNIASRAVMPAITVSLDTTNDELDMDLPAGAPGIVSLGAPAAASLPIRTKIIYWHFSDVDDAQNIPLLHQDEGTVVGTNGNGQQMNASWSGVFGKIKNKA